MPICVVSVTYVKLFSEDMHSVFCDVLKKEWLKRIENLHQHLLWALWNNFWNTTSYKQPLEKMLYRKHKCSISSHNSQVEKLSWKSKNTVDGHPHTNTCKCWKGLRVNSSRCLTIHNLCEKINLSYGSCQCTLFKNWICEWYLVNLFLIC